MKLLLFDALFLLELLELLPLPLHLCCQVVLLSKMYLLFDLDLLLVLRDVLMQPVLHLDRLLFQELDLLFKEFVPLGLFKVKGKMRDLHVAGVGLSGPRLEGPKLCSFFRGSRRGT